MAWSFQQDVPYIHVTCKYKHTSTNRKWCLSMVVVGQMKNY